MKKIKHYNILELLGSGGMGEVYKAFDSVLEREVAIKIMHRHLWDDEKTDKRFLQETRAVASLSNPNIVTVFEVGKVKMGRYIVMEYVPGQSLKAIIENDEPYDAQYAVKMASQILHGLASAHQIGLIHRDIKPDNVLVTHEQVAKILDFGIAKVMAKEGLTAAGDILGTVEYMPPEQMLGDAVDQRCDLYSTGIILYQLLTRRLPFLGDNPVAILYKVLNEEPLPPSHYDKSVSREIDRIVLKAIHKGKEDRWQGAEDFMNALQSVTSDGAVSTVSSDAASLALPFDPSDDADVLRPAFVARDEDFKRMVNLLAGAMNGQGHTVILSGEAGVGKTTLANRLRNYAELNGAWVLYGACLYQDGFSPYQPYLDALRAFFDRDNKYASAEERVQIDQRIRKEVPLLTHCEGVFDGDFVLSLSEAVEKSKSDKTQLFETIHQLLDMLSQITPCVVMVDDLHWADEASVKLFHYLSHHVKNNRIVLVGITRTERYDLQQDGKPTMIVDMLARLRREGHCEQVALSRLNRENCDRLVDKALSPCLFNEEFYELLYKETHGNPLFTRETLKLLIENGTIFEKDGSWYNKQDTQELAVPTVVKDVFLRRLNALNEEEREILQVASVVGTRFDPSQVVPLLGTTRIKLLRVLQRVETELQILVSTERGFRFEHPMLRDLLYNEIPRALRREYHLMVVEEVEKECQGEFGVQVGDVAQHLRKAGEHAKAVPLLYQAALRAFKLAAYHEATAFIVDYLDSVENSGLSEDESILNLNLYLKLGRCYEETGRWSESLDAYKLMLDLSKKRQDVEGQVDALERMGRLQVKTGDADTGLKTYKRCIKLVEKNDVPKVASRLHNTLGIIYRTRGQFEQALKSLRRAIELSKEDEDEHTRAHALLNLGIIAYVRHEYDLALENYEKALKTYVLKGDEKNQARVYHNIAMTYADKKQWEQSIDIFARCLQLAEKLEDKHLHGLVYLNMGKTYAQYEKLAEAKASADKALKMFKLIGDTLSVAEAYHVLGLIHSARGSFSESEI